MKKKWYMSKTMWFNIITITLGIIQVVSETYPIPTNVLVIVNGIGNMILRSVTTTGIGSEE